MKMWIKQMIVPAALVGASMATPALADPRDVLKSNHGNNGAIVRSQYGSNAAASLKEREKVSQERIHMQTQAQQAAMGGEAASEREGDTNGNDAARGQAVQTQSDDNSALASQSSRVGLYDKQLGTQSSRAGVDSNSKGSTHTMHIAMGDSPEATHSTSTAGTSNKKQESHAFGVIQTAKGEKPHFSAAQSEELGSGERSPADTGSTDKSASHAGAQAKATSSSKGSGEPLHLSAQQAQEVRPEGAGDSSGSKLATRGEPMERATTREMRSAEPRAMVIVHESSDAHFHTPQAFYH